ncbi:hypothetical protein JR316_0002443 [Psilocybe cubensis]|uniref:GDP-fucose protein O-fucosyltransferase 2 n=2 Tax=Psilocybe cubensis TaxID=181762 RepID=A0A8H8CPK3_PSICU|nr:hypothetical protein JR316_0002443 [Psilocybe cubensis]KAH9485533.1 hypothetical protein JR316_0002443 [Psilocybe cubensis]
MVNERVHISDRYFRPRAGTGGSLPLGSTGPSGSKTRQRHGSRIQRFLQRLRMWFMLSTRGRRTLAAVVFFFSVLLCIFILEPHKVYPSNRFALREFNIRRWGAAKGAEVSSEAVNGPATRKFRGECCIGFVLLKPSRLNGRNHADNLRNDTSYITSWSNAGFTNQFMGYVNMIYLGLLTDRVPILPPFAPDHHISSSAGIIPFGDLFDLDHLRKQLRTPILEWRDVKALPSRYSADPYSTREVEPLGCWTTRKESEGNPIRAENVVHHLGLDVSYTRVPSHTRLDPSNPEETHVVFPHLAALIYPIDPIADPESFRTLAPSPGGHWDTPESQLSCFDTMYYATSGAKAFEWQYSWSPVWRTVGRHVRFTREIEDLGYQYLSNVFGLDEAEEVPPFIIVHIRRGDFAMFCSHSGQVDCFPPLSTYKKRVDDVKMELMERDIPVTNVVVVSDEKSPRFWANVKNQEWFYINHTAERTLERFGEWYPPLVDIVVQSYAFGFVGTEDSTFSLVGQRRVEDWNGGVTMNVKVQVGY